MPTRSRTSTSRRTTCECSHASTVGPVDEDQRYYLESRGVEPDVAERLIVAGFFEDIADQGPDRRYPTVDRPGAG